MDQIRWLINDGHSMEVIQDAWISNIPLSRWSILVSSEVEDHMRVSNLITVDTPSWQA